MTIGRWGHIHLDYRICKMCDGLVVEDEYHYIFHSSLYKNIRTPFLHMLVILSFNIKEMSEIYQIHVYVK